MSHNLNQSSQQSQKRAIPWKENRLISIKLRNGKYVLAQMLKDPYMIFFNQFKETNHWEEIQLSSDDVLFCRAVARQFVKLSHAAIVKDVAPLRDYVLPKVWLYVGDGSHRKQIQLKNQSYNLIVSGDYYSLVERDMEDHRNNTISGIYKKVLLEQIDKSKYEDLNGIEDMSIDMYPNLNERLYLCSLEGKNVNPYMDIRFDKDLPESYEAFLDVITGKAARWGY